MPRPEPAESRARWESGSGRDVPHDCYGCEDSADGRVLVYEDPEQSARGFMPRYRVYLHLCRRCAVSLAVQVLESEVAT